MGLFSRLFGTATSPPPRAAYQSPDGGVIIRTAQELEAALTAGAESASGTRVTPETAMRVAAVYACVRIISGAVANLPIDIKRRVDDRTREDASDLAIWTTLRRRPNKWQKPAQFKRMMQAHVLLRGNAYAAKVKNFRGEVLALIPLHPDRVEVKQLDDLSLEYLYTRKDGGRVRYKQDEMLHLMGLTLDGIKGVSPIAYARESIGLSMAMERQGAAVFRNGARVSGMLSHPSKLGKETVETLRASLQEFREGGALEGKDLVLEEGMKYERMAMTQEDAQWIESRKFSRSDIAMFFGVPPHMIGDTEKSTSWGSGIEQQSQGFVTYTLEDHLTMWEEAVTADLNTDPLVYARFKREALVRGDLKARWEAHVKSMQWGVRSPNEIRTMEDENPREGGDVYYDPPNAAGGSNGDTANEPAPTS